MRRLFSDLEPFKDQTALICDDGRSVTYGELVTLADETARSIGAQRRLVFIEIANELEPIAAYVGAMRAGHAVVLMAEDGGQPENRLYKAFPPEFVYSRANGAWAFQRHAGAPLALHDDLAVLLSTSGTTGSPKLVRLSHENLTSNSHAIEAYLALAPGERAITSLPPHYSYGMSVINSHLQFGHALILTDRSVADREFWELADRHAATSFAGVPHTFDLLERSGFLQASHPSLRYFTQAGGRLLTDKVTLFARFAAERGQRFFVMYGQTEASPRMAYVPPHDVERYPNVIGQAIPGGELSLRDPDPDAGEAGHGGELVYRGPNVMMGYAVTRDDLTLGSGPSELRTGDLAVLNEAGYFRIVGRASRFLKIFGLRIGLDDVEATLAAAGFDAVATGDDEGLVVAITQAGRERAAQGILADRLKLPQNRITVAAPAEIPRLATGKVDYPAVLRLRPVASRAASQDLRSQMADTLGVDEIDDADTFISLGGDSLSYVQASLLLEETLGSIPDNWETLSFGELARSTPQVGPKQATLETSVFVRGLAVLMVVLDHVTSSGWGGAATVLFIIAGLNFSRFQVGRLEQGGGPALAKATALRIGLPYFFVVSMYFLLVHHIFVPQYLLYSNFTEGFFVDGVRRLTIYWFIEDYIFIVLFLCAAFLFAPVRKFSQAFPKVFAAAFFVACLIVGGMAQAFPKYDAFREHTPIAMAYLFAFGWLIDRFKALSERLVLAAGGAVMLYFIPADNVPMALPLVTVSFLVLMFVKRVPVTPLFAKGLSAVAAASLYIYIFHGLVIQAARRAVGDIHWLQAPFVYALCLGLGLAIWRLAEFAGSRPGRDRLTQLTQLVVGRAAR